MQQYYGQPQPVRSLPRSFLHTWRAHPIATLALWQINRTIQGEVFDASDARRCTGNSNR